MIHHNFKELFHIGCLTNIFVVNQINQLMRNDGDDKTIMRREEANTNSIIIIVLLRVNQQEKNKIIHFLHSQLPGITQIEILKEFNI